MSTVHDVPAGLRDFQRTLRVPGGESAKEFLAGFVDYMNADPPQIGAVHEQVLVADVVGWRLTTTVYVPDQQGLAVPLLYFHGGAWCFGSPLTHDRLSRELASRGIAVFSVDYRRAPKHPFPAAVEDGQLALEWLGDNLARFGCREDLVFVGGDSAGANIAAGVAVATTPVELAGVVLLGGIFDYERSLVHLSDLLAGPDGMPQHYVRPDDLEWARHDKRLNPALAPQLLPPALILCGSQDPLLDESLSLASSLIAQGVDVDSFWVEGEGHGFLQDPRAAGYRAGFDRIEAFINRRSMTRTEVVQ